MTQLKTNPNQVPQLMENPNLLLLEKKNQATRPMTQVLKPMTPLKNQVLKPMTQLKRNHVPQLKNNQALNPITQLSVLQ